MKKFVTKLTKLNFSKKFIHKFNLKNKLFINGEFVDSVSKKTFPVINPYDETVLTTVNILFLTKRLLKQMKKMLILQLNQLKKL
jgi:hypothetical protein